MENVPSDGGYHREKLILQEIDRLVKERDDLRAKLNRAAMLIDRLTEENHQMVWLTDRVERAEAVKESLTSALVKIIGFSAYWKCLRGNEEAWENVWNIATDALISLRTAEESSVVGLIDSTPAKQFPNAVNADGYEDILFDIEPSLHAQTEDMKSLLESQSLSPELAALGRELVRLAEKSLGEVTE